MIPARAALARLKDGNRRFVSAEQRARSSMATPPGELAQGQQPFATVLGCSDSRVPTEIVFDQAAGDLFVVRVAGNVISPAVVDSVEFGTGVLGTRLVVVMGHTRCGAVAATLEHLQRGGADTDPTETPIVDWVRRSVEPLLSTGPDMAADEVISRGVRANVRASVDYLRNESPALTELRRTQGLRIVGAEYCLEAGTVDFFDVTSAGPDG